MAGRKYVFPVPGKCKLRDGAVHCSAERVIALYNQENGESRVRVTQTIQDWFSEEAQRSGWAGCCFLPDVQSGHGAGCVLFVPPQQVNVQISVTNKTLVLIADK